MKFIKWYIIAFFIMLICKIIANLLVPYGD